MRLIVAAYLAVKSSVSACKCCAAELSNEKDRICRIQQLCRLTTPSVRGLYYAYDTLVANYCLKEFKTEFVIPIKSIMICH